MTIAEQASRRPPVPPAGGPRRHRGKHGVRTVLMVLLVLGSVLVVGAMSLVVIAQRHLTGQIDRIDGVFAGLDHRPAKPQTGSAARALNILVMGTDRRSDQATTGSQATAGEWVPGAQRTDTIMILHIDGSRDGASLVSIPRDSWVDVPGHGYNKINAAFSFAGPALAVQTVEDLTGVRIDHLAVVDWSGYRALVDAVGGVSVTVPRTVEDPHFHVVWTQGRHILDGDQALLYARQRYGLPLGDLDRERRQQAVLRGLIQASGATLRSASPLHVYDFLDVLTENISVDSDWRVDEMRSLMMSLRRLHVGSMQFLSAPVAGFGREGAQSVVYLDEAGNRSLWAAVRDDDVAHWAATHDGRQVTGPVP